MSYHVPSMERRIELLGAAFDHFDEEFGSWAEGHPPCTRRYEVWPTETDEGAPVAAVVSKSGELVATFCD